MAQIIVDIQSMRIEIPLSVYHKYLEGDKVAGVRFLKAVKEGLRTCMENDEENMIENTEIDEEDETVCLSCGEPLDEISYTNEFCSKECESAG